MWESLYIAKANLSLSFSFETSLDDFDLVTVTSLPKEQLTKTLTEPLVFLVVAEGDDPALYRVSGHVLLVLFLSWI